MQRKLTLQPPNVLLLLLEGNVVGDHVLELDVQTTLLEVTAPEGDQVRVEVLSRRTGVETLASPVLLSGVGVGDLRILEVGDLLDLKIAILNDGLDQQGTVLGLLDSDVDAGGECGRQDLVFTLGVAAFLALALQVALVGKSFVGELVPGILGDVVNVGDGEGNADTI